MSILGKIRQDPKYNLQDTCLNLKYKERLKLEG